MYTPLQEILYANRKLFEILQDVKRPYGDRNKKMLSLCEHATGSAMILLKVDASLEEVLAAIYHDWLEPYGQDVDACRRIIRERHGEDILTFVESLTEPREGVSWRQRKETYLRTLIASEPRISQVSAALKITGLIYADRCRRANMPISEWSQGSYPENVWFHEELLAIYERKEVHRDLLELYREQLGRLKNWPQNVPQHVGDVR